MATWDGHSWTLEERPSVHGTTDQHGWGFALLAATTASLFIRPSDLVPGMHGWPLYQFFIILCTMVALKPLFGLFLPSQFIRTPMLACLMLLALVAFASNAWNGHWWQARNSAWNISKLAVLFMLVLGLVNGKARLLTFLHWQILFVTIMVGLALFDYYDIFEVASMQAIVELDPNATQEGVTVARLRGTGIFEDPNDLGLVIVTNIVLSVCFMTQRSVGWVRYFWLLPIGILLLGLANTHSRGAFLSFAVTVPAWLYVRGGKRSALWGSLASLPFLFLIFSGRMTDIDAVFEGTGQSRIHIWSDALMAMRSSMWFGIGEGMFVEEFGVVTHNSFLQCFAELGVFGGTAFVALFVAGFTNLSARVDDEEIEHVRGFVFAALIGYLVGLMTLSRQFEAPTYLLLGLVAAVQNLGHVENDRRTELNLEFAFRSAIAAGIFIFVMAIFVRIFIDR